MERPMKKHIVYTIKGVVGSLLLASLSAGCAQEEFPDGTTPGKGDMNGKSYVTLSFVSKRTVLSRANPTGGETGDGLETGQSYENEISSAVAFFYRSDAGVNANATTPILGVAAFNSVVSATSPATGIDRVYTTAAQQVNLDDGTYNVLVVANPGEDWWTGQTLTLGEVRDHIQQQAWTMAADGNTYSDFVMTSANELGATLELASNPEDDPAKATVSVERMAARLDYQSEAVYNCTDPNFTGATIEITGAALVNNLTAGSYLLKRVAANVDGSPLYLGDETADANGQATNYVIDPWTQAKTADASVFLIDGIARETSYLYGTWFGNCSQDPNWWNDYVRVGTSISDGTENWLRIGYTLENTVAAGITENKYSTGVVFKAKFHPVGLTQYADGATFFALGSHLFASMEQMMAYVYGAAFDSFDASIEACSDWEDVQAFVTGTLLDTDPSGYKQYLQKVITDKASTTEFAELKSSLTWKAYMRNECGYSASLSTPEGTATGVYQVSLDQPKPSGEEQVTRIALQPYGVRTYEEATCYYIWWVRHSNDNNPDTDGIMEYATVRNNIYKLKVKSIYSLGGDVPDEDHQLVVDVYVNNWLLLPVEYLPM